MFRQVTTPRPSNTYTMLSRHRNFAENVGIKFHTPEEYFLADAPRQFTRSFQHSEYLLSSTTEGTGTHPSSNDRRMTLVST
jgi:bifunctional polynucleotide phosphatase/kinase